VNGKFVIREVRTTQVDEVDVFDDSEDPEAEFIPGLAVAGDFTCDRLTCDGGQLTCEPTGTITCPEFNLANSICTVDGTITGGGPLLVFTVTGGSIDGNGLIQGDLQLVGDAVLSPGSSPGTLTVNTLTMGGGTTYTWEVSDFAGTEGVTTDLVENNGNLVLTGTVADPVTIRPVTLDAAGNPGLAANWDPVKAGQWLLVRNAGSISGFSPDTVVVDAGGVANPPFGGRFDVAVDGTDLVLRYTPSDFAIWQAAEFPDSADRAAGAAGDLASDPDRDRLPNLIEYALGTDPRGSGPFTPLLVELTGSGASRTATATFPRRPTANDLHLILEVSDDLSPSGWSTLAESLRGAPATGEGGLVIGEFGTDPLTVTVDNIAAPESGPGQYFRLLAEQRPLLPPGP
jgi:hypothetical protein